MDAAALVSKVKTEGGFAVDDATALGWVNEVYSDAVARAGWIERVVSLGNTANGVSRYVISDTYVDIRSIKVGTARFTIPVSVQQMWDLQSGAASFSGKIGDGVFAEGFDATDVRYVELFPTPTTVAALSAFVSVLPTDLVLGPPPTSPVLPADLHPMLIAGATALGLTRWSERDDLAAAKQAVYESKIKELQTRANARVGGAPSDRELVYGSDLVSKVKAEGNFDVADATVLGWVNEAYRDAVARSGWLRQQLSLGSTVAGQATYAIPETVVEVRSVNVGGARYGLVVSLEEMWDFASGDANIVQRAPSGGGAVAAGYDSAGARFVQLYPVPGTSGTTITALVTVMPIDLTLNPVTNPALPADISTPMLAAGATAIGYSRWQGRQDMAQGPQALFEAKVEELRRRANARVGQSRAQRMPVAGYDF